jgi:hypothetical protein
LTFDSEPPVTEQVLIIIISAPALFCTREYPLSLNCALNETISSWFVLHPIERIEILGVSVVLVIAMTKDDFVKW